MENFYEHQIGISDYITGNRFIDTTIDSSAVFCKTDFLRDYSDKTIDVFLTHNSDYGIDSDVYSLGPRHKHWLAQNKECEEPSIIPIPIGLENMRIRTHSESMGGKYSSEVPGAQQKAETIDRLSSFNMHKTGTVYMNFNIKTSPVERGKVWEMFSNQPWVSKTSSLPIDHFYFELSSHKFVLSPRGNGLDCHRTWEALYLKTIPIVKRHSGMSYFDDLPIYFVDSWDEITKESLDQFYEKTLNTEYDLGKMKMSWWREKIINLTNGETI